jgi:plastocyanin
MPSTSKPHPAESARPRLWWTVALVLGCVVALSTVWHRRSAVTAESVTYRILIEGMKFSPAAIQVRAGDRIEFKNLDFVPHTATSTTKQIFDSGILQSGDSWTLTCREVGVTDYRCLFHPVMTGSIEILSGR